MYKNYEERIPLVPHKLPSIDITQFETDEGDVMFKLEVDGVYVGEYESFHDAIENYECYMWNHGYLE